MCRPGYRGVGVPGPRTVALSRPFRAPLPGAGADHRGQLGVDQRLIDRCGRGPDPVVDISGFEYLENLEQGRLFQGHRVLCPIVENHCRGLADHHTVAPHDVDIHAVKGLNYLHHPMGRGRPEPVIR